MTSKAPILFLLAHRNHLERFLPLIRELKREGCPVRCVVPDETVGKATLAADRIRALSELAPVERLRRGLGERLLARLAPTRFDRKRRWAARLGRWLRRRRLHPSVVVVPFHPVFGGLRSAVGGDTRIVCIQHDPYHADPRSGLAGFELDLFLAWGSQLEEALLEHPNPARLKVTGSPYLEVRPPAEGPRKGEPIELLYATQPAAEMGSESIVTASMKRRAIEDLVAALEEIPTLRITVKLHPADDGRTESELLRADPSVASRVRLVPHDPEISIIEWIDRSDVVATILSTAAFEGLVRGKPVLLLNYDRIVDRTVDHFICGRDYLSDGVALESADRPGLVRALESLVHDEALRDRLRERRLRFLDKHLRYSGQESVRRICAELTGRSC